MATPITREEAIELFRQMFEEKMAIMDEQSDSSDSESDSSDSESESESESDEEDIPAWVTDFTLDEANKKVTCDICGRKLLIKNLKPHRKTKTCKQT